MVFADEFNTKQIDSTKWMTEYFPHASTDEEGKLATYQLKDDSLRLYIDKNKPNYYSTTMQVSSLQTFEKNLLHPGVGTTNVTDVETTDLFACKYGYFEMRAKLPDCDGGGHVAWWLVGTQDDAQTDGTGSVQTGEIDILETTFDSPNTYSPKVHKWTDTNLTEFEENVTLEGDYTGTYHTYAMNWTPEGITFYVDGVQIATTTNSPNYEMAMLLGIYTNCDWDGEVNDVYPKNFYIDYIRVYQEQNGYVTN